LSGAQNIWDIITSSKCRGRKHEYCKTPLWSAQSARISVDGQRVLAFGEDGVAQIYTTDMDELLEISKSRVTRQLTVEEKDRYGILDW